MLGFAKRHVIIFIYFALISSTLLVFWQAGNFDFVNYDDNFYVYENPHVLNGLNIDSFTWAFTSCYQGYWQPLTWLSLMMNSQLFGPGPAGFHLVNVFLHLANTLLLFAVLKKMTGKIWQSAFVAMLFAIHPMHVESVAWIAERKDVLSAFFLLLTLLVYTSYVKKPTIFRYITSLVLFAFGLMSKPMLVTIPFILLLLDYWPLNRISNQKSAIGKLLLEKVPFFILAVASCVVTVMTQRAGGIIVNIDEVPLKERIINTFFSYAAYIGKFTWPCNLAAHYPFKFNAITGFSLGYLLLYALLLGGVSLLAIYFWSSRKYLLVGWLWFLGTLVPVIGLVQFTGTSYADRFTYIPYIGLFIMLAWGLPELLSKLPYRKFAIGISAVLALAALGAGSYRQAGFWKDGCTLFSHAVDVTTDNYFAYNNLGTAYEHLGRLQDAVNAYRQAVKIKPDFINAYYNLGNAYSGQSRYQDAIDAYQKAVKFKPDFADAHYNLGNACSNLRRYQDAADAYRQAIKIKPDFADALYNFGDTCLELGRYQDAIDSYRQFIGIRPGSAEVYINLGAAFYKLGRYQDTIESLKQAVKIKPDFVEAYSNLGFVYLESGDKASALEEYEILKNLGANQQADQLYNLINK